MGLTIIIGIFGAIWMMRDRLFEETGICRLRHWRLERKDVGDFVFSFIWFSFIGFAISAALSLAICENIEKTPSITTFVLSPISEGRYIETDYVLLDYRDPSSETPMIRYIVEGAHKKERLSHAIIHLNADSPRLEKTTFSFQNKVLSFLLFSEAATTYDLYSPENQIGGDFLITE